MSEIHFNPFKIQINSQVVLYNLYFNVILFVYSLLAVLHKPNNNKHNKAQSRNISLNTNGTRSSSPHILPRFHFVLWIHTCRTFSLSVFRSFSIYDEELKATREPVCRVEASK